MHVERRHINIVKDVPVRKAGPTQNLPQKSHEVMHVERRHIKHC